MSPVSRRSSFPNRIKGSDDEGREPALPAPALSPLKNEVHVGALRHPQGTRHHQLFRLDPHSRKQSNLFCSLIMMKLVNNKSVWRLFFREVFSVQGTDVELMSFFTRFLFRFSINKAGKHNSHPVKLPIVNCQTVCGSKYHLFVKHPVIVSQMSQLLIMSRHLWQQNYLDLQFNKNTIHLKLYNMKLLSLAIFNIYLN